MKNLRMKRKTLEEIEAIDKDILVPEDVAGYLGIGEYAINMKLKSGGEFPFPAYLVGTHVKIPKQAFIDYHRSHAFSEQLKQAEREEKMIKLLQEILKQLKKYNQSINS